MATIGKFQVVGAPMQAKPLLEAMAAREDQLRQLLSYCTAKPGTRNGVGEYYDGERDAYGDVAEKLAAILDGES
jgi:hypothetical protein